MLAHNKRCVGLGGGGGSRVMFGMWSEHNGIDSFLLSRRFEGEESYFEGKGKQEMLMINSS